MTMVIFDCDGVLVDSEVLFNRIVAEQLTACGYPVDTETSIARFTGMSMPSLISLVEQEWGQSLPADFADRCRTIADPVFDAELAPIPGISEVLLGHDGLRCVASSSAPRRIERSLRTTGLIDHFGMDTLFSAAMVGRGKPAPDLFLHAAQKMGVAPAACVVIEDSLLGAEAAVAAGMPALGFTGGGHIRQGHAENLRSVGVAAVFDDMTALPGLLAGFS